jgi:N-acetylmuramoyl-L-alanine amidase
MSGYTVSEGEHVPGVAQQHGYPDFDKVWNDPENADLKKLRKNPNVLYPGDVVAIPEKQLREESAATEKHHDYVLKGQPLLLRLKLEKMYYKPIADTPCDLLVGLDDFSTPTDHDGQMEHKIRKNATSAEVTIHDTVDISDSPTPVDTPFTLKIGHLDPVEEVSGQAARLSNLGYYRGPLDPPDPDDFRLAIEEFQFENGLDHDGICGPDTQGMLSRVHGC